MHCWRLGRGVARHAGKAPAAASIAASTSSDAEAWKKPRLLPRDAGFSFPKVAPPRARLHAPPIRFSKVSAMRGPVYAGPAAYGTGRERYFSCRIVDALRAATATIMPFTATIVAMASTRR